MSNQILSKVVSLGLAALVTLSILATLQVLTPMPVQGSLLAASPAASQVARTSATVAMHG